MLDWLLRWCADIVDRVGGPMTFRIILQPLMATLLAVRGGLRDAKEDRPPYFWSILTDPSSRPALLREGWKAVARVFVLAIVMDFIYQLVVLRWLYPIQLFIVAILLAVVPYLLIRGPVNRIARLFQRKRQPLPQTLEK